MNNFTRIALAAGLLSATTLPAFAQTGTSPTGTSQTGTPPAGVTAVTPAHKMAKKPATPTAAHVAPAKAATPHS